MSSITKARSIVVAAASLGAALAGCADGAGFAACDIRDADCQERTFDAVVALRGGSARMPRITVVDEAGFLARMELREKGESPADAAARALTFARWNRGLALFRLAPPDYDEQQATRDWSEQVGGGYFPSTKEIVIIDRGGVLADEATAVQLLAHEFVHALQDAEHDFEHFGDALPDTFDASLAISSIIEGEAVMYQALAGAALAGYATSRLDWGSFFGRFRSRTLAESDADAAPVNLAGMRFPYAFGGSFVTQHWLARGPAGVAALFASPPLSTHAVMFGGEHGVLSPAQEDLRSMGVPVLEGEFEEVASTGFGAWITQMFAARAGHPPEQRLGVARDLEADWFSVQSGADDAVVAAWRKRPRTALVSLERWPGLRGPAPIRGYADAELRELLLLAASAAAPIEVVAWQAPTGAPEPDGDMPSAGFGAGARLLARAGLACGRAIGALSIEELVGAAR